MAGPSNRYIPYTERRRQQLVSVPVTLRGQSITLDSDSSNDGINRLPFDLRMNIAIARSLHDTTTIPAVPAVNDRRL